MQDTEQDWSGRDGLRFQTSYIWPTSKICLWRPLEAPGNLNVEGGERSGPEMCYLGPLSHKR